jgi:glycerol kinase
MQMLADALGLPVECPALLDSAAVGAAELAGRAIDLWRDEQVRSRWQLGSRYVSSLSADEGAERFATWQRRVALVREAGA